MISPEKIKVSKKNAEKQLRQTIREKLAAALADYRNGMNEKDFRESLKKASKIISNDLSKAAAKKKKKSKKTGKRSAKKQKEFLM